MNKNRGLLLLSLLLSIVAVFSIAGHKIVFQQAPSVPLNVPQPISAPFTTYNSDKLRVSFSYLTQVAGRVNFYVKEIGNTIYLYYNPEINQPFQGSDEEFLNKIPPGHGYSIKVFSKNINQTLTDAIKEQFLNGYKDSECVVKKISYGHSKNDGSIQTAVISVNSTSNSKKSRTELNDAVAKCPQYTTAFGVSYFMMDSKHADKFLFVHLGQDNIPSGVDGSTWDETLKIF